MRASRDAEIIERGIKQGGSQVKSRPWLSGRAVLGVRTARHIFYCGPEDLDSNPGSKDVITPNKAFLIKGI